jgi:hypothetical protein
MRHVLLAAALLVMGANAHAEDQGVLEAMSRGLYMCETYDGKPSIQHFPGKLWELPPALRDDLVTVLTTRGHEDAAKEFQDGEKIIVQIKNFDLEPLHPVSFSYHVINKDKAGKWCDLGSSISGTVFLNAPISRYFNKKYQPD